MKILIFEYICGGGLAGGVLPDSLAAEGGIMLQALADDLNCLPQVSLLAPLDKRCLHLQLPADAEIVPVDSGQDLMNLLPDLIKQCDAVWPIAPETGGLLAGIAEMTTAQKKILLSSSADAIALCGDKFATCRRLSARQLPVAETSLLAGFNYQGGKYVIKPVDGVACEGSVFVENVEAFQQTVGAIENPAQHIIQPYIAGRAMSLSCLCKSGKAWLLCCNQQQIVIEDDGFVLNGCLVNVPCRQIEVYQKLLDGIAAAVPGLFGYIGVDFIEIAEQGPLLLEINPRLTASYAGIRQATGINVAEQVLALLRGEPDLRQSCNRVVDITFS